MPILLGLIPHLAALRRTVITACCASCSGPIVLLIIMLSLGRRYLTTNAVTPMLAIASPIALSSCALAKPAYEPRGYFSMAAPFAVPFTGKYGVIVGML